MNKNFEIFKVQVNRPTFPITGHDFSIYLKTKKIIPFVFLQSKVV